jgi:hypothetical protein
VQIAGTTPGVARDGNEAGGRGEVPGIRVCGEVSGGGDELGAEEGAHARQGFDDPGLWIGPEGLADLPVDAPQSVVQGQDLRGQVGDDLGGDVLSASDLDDLLARLDRHTTDHPEESSAAPAA